MTKPEITPRGMTMAQLVEYIGRSYPTVRKMIALGIIPGPVQAWGGKHFFDRKAIDAALDALSEGKVA